MDRFLKSKEGPAADIWSMLQREVYAPIGIHQAPTNRTIETDGSETADNSEVDTSRMAQAANSLSSFCH